MVVKGNSSNSTEAFWDRLFDSRSLPYVALVALTAIVGITADSGAEIRAGNVCFNAEKGRETLTGNETGFNSEITVNSNVSE